MPQRIETPSLVDQARESIVQAILDGEFDAKLPPEDQLAEMLNVSRTTVRSAIQALENEGLVTRRRSAGTTIHRQGLSALALRQLIGFDQLLVGLGYRVRVESTWQRSPSPDNQSSTPWPAIDDAFVISKTYLADDRQAIAICDVVPWTNLRVAPTRRSSLPASLFDFSRKFCSEPIARATMRLIPMVARPGTTTLDIDNGAAFLRLHETHATATGIDMAWSMIDFNDELLQLEIARG
jgi:GntR family transcriptional regulator